MAQNACVSCRKNKKGCNKALPCCARCERLDRSCAYNNTSDVEGIDFTESVSLQMTTVNLFRETQTLLTRFAKSPAELSQKYFDGLHAGLPIFSRDKFLMSLSKLDEHRDTDFSLALLMVCILGDRDTDCITIATLYKSVRLILTLRQCDSKQKTSLSLLQTVLLTAIYHYNIGEMDEALSMISIAFRTKYMLDLSRLGPYEEEVRLVDWALILMERMVVIETSHPDQRLLTILPTDVESRGDGVTQRRVNNSFDPQILTRVSTRSDANKLMLGVLQTLDQVLQCIAVNSLVPGDPQFICIQRKLQTHLQMALTQSSRPGMLTSFCYAVAITIRIVFLLYWPDHINFNDLEANSLAFLDTIIIVLLDIEHTFSDFDDLDRLPLPCRHNLSAACAYLGKRAQQSPQLLTAKKRLATFQQRLKGRWKNPAL